jgi:hypothetical protein
MWNCSGSREPFLVLVDTGWDGDLHGVYVADFFAELYYEDFDDGGPEWSAVWEIMHDIERSIRQAEKLIALARDWDHAQRLYNQHLQGMTRLLTELKRAMINCDITFADGRRS